MRFPPNILYLPFYFTGSPDKKMSVELFAHDKPQLHLQEDTACHREWPFSSQLENPIFFFPSLYFPPSSPAWSSGTPLGRAEIPKVTDFPQLKDACE